MAAAAQEPKEGLWSVRIKNTFKRLSEHLAEKEYSRLKIGSPETESTHNSKGNAPLLASMFDDYPGTQDPNGTGTGLAIACDNGGAFNVVNDYYTLIRKGWFRSPLNRGSPGPKLWQFGRDLAAIGNIQLLPRIIEDLSADTATFTTERMGLVLDSGASMHAVGEARIMHDIQPLSFDMWATLPDDSDLRVIGIGTIEMNGFSIPNVSLVEGLEKNLISVGQLDEDHGMCCCFHGGQCKVMLPDGSVVGGAILEDDGLYKLRFLEVPQPEE